MVVAGLVARGALQSLILSQQGYRTHGLKQSISRTKNLLKLLWNLVLGSVEEKPGCLRLVWWDRYNHNPGVDVDNP
jgi:hypothetical protein